MDKAIEYIGSDEDAQKPFFAYVAFQAVHIPVQAPAAFRDKYLKLTPTAGTRYAQRAAKVWLSGHFTQRIAGSAMPTTPDWESLTPEQQAFEARGMAVYAGMVDAMDHHIGRLVDHIDSIGELDNTIFIFLSDNGAEGSWQHGHWVTGQMRRLSPSQSGCAGLATTPTAIRWVTRQLSRHWPAWASAAVGPLAWYKFFAGEGGLRVPLVISGSHDGQNVTSQIGGVSHALGWAPDIVPTVLGLAGVQTSNDFAGKTLVPVLAENQPQVRGEDEGFGYELGGNEAWFQGDYKLVFNRYGDSPDWQLFNLRADPAETRDLSGGACAL